MCDKLNKKSWMFVMENQYEKCMNYISSYYTLKLMSKNLKF